MYKKIISDKLHNDILNGVYDEGLLGLYECSLDKLPYYRGRSADVIQGFCEIFDKERKREVCLFSSPGRLELCGNHTDHQGGVVLTGTADADIFACVAQNNSDYINVYSKGYESFSLKCDDTVLRDEEKNTSQALVRGVLKYFQDRKVRAGGFDVYAVSDVLGGLGMSSSAAFEALIAKIINVLFCDDRLSNTELVFSCVYAEQKYFGKPCGMMDQMAVISGGINLFDFKEEKRPVRQAVDFDFESAGLDITVIDTGTEHSAMAEDFNTIPKEMFLAANVLNKARLCEIEEDCYLKNEALIRSKAGDRAFLRGLHWYGEVKRVRQAAKYLQSNDTEGFLKMIRSSGRSSFMYLQNVDNYKNPFKQPVATSLALAEYALQSEGAVRIQGGGFAGSIITFTYKEATDDFLEFMEKSHGKGMCKRVGIRKKGVCRLIC